MLKTHSTS